jgi:hypothetical protein
MTFIALSFREPPGSLPRWLFVEATNEPARDRHDLADFYAARATS